MEKLGINGSYLLAQIVNVLIFLFTCAALVLALRWLIKRGGTANQDARGILKQRLAKGEITEEEYRRLKNVITAPDRHEDQR